MKHYTYSLFFLTSLALSACGGGSAGTATSAGATDTTQTAAVGTASTGGSSSSTPSLSTPDNATAATTAPATTTSSSSTTTSSTSSSSGTPQIIEYYGDSTVWGYNSGVGGQVQTPAPLAFAQALPQYDVRNEGVSGTTACQLVNGTDGKHPAWSTQMANSKATYVLANFAINDEWAYDMNTYKSCLHTLAQTAKQYGKQMIFETPNPTRDSGPTGLDTMVAAMKEVASQEGVKVIDQYQYLTNYLNGASPYTICPDGLHPTQAVYIMKGQYAAQMFPTVIQ